MIVVHAGHRVDTPERDRGLFPPKRDGSVYRRLYLLLLELQPRLVVSAAAGGADLLMLRVAEDLFIPRLVALPLPVNEFRHRSVSDQGQRWVDAFDQALAHADDVIVADLSDHAEWPIRGNDHIQACAVSAIDGSPNGTGEPIVAVVVKSSSCPPSSATADFATKASSRGWPVHTIDPFLD